MNLASYIDAALLSADSTPQQVKALCKEATKNKYYGVDVLPCSLSLAKKELGSSTVTLIGVVGYPLGQHTTAAKVFETKEAVKAGADEIDIVMNVGWFKAGKKKDVKDEIQRVVAAAKKRPVKVIIETGYLSAAEIQEASLLVKKAGAHFVKTGSGYGPRDVTAKDVMLIKNVVGNFGIKAAGGIRTAKQAKALIEAGATRIGTSSPQKIIRKV